MQGFFNEVALDFVTHGGERLPVLVNAAEKRDAEGRHLFTRMTVFNATDRRRYERELLHALAHAEAAVSKPRDVNAAAQANLLSERATAAIREQFIAVLSHDLRNPLIAIDSGMQMLLGMPMNDKAPNHRQPGSGQHGSHGRPDRGRDGLRAWPRGRSRSLSCRARSVPV